MSKGKFLITATYFYLLLLGATLLLNRILLQEILPHAPGMDPRAAATILLGSILLIGIMYLLLRHDQVFIPKILDRLRQLQGVLLELSQAEMIYLSLLAGVAEELLFRGLLQPLLGIAPASLLFGAMHAVTFGYFLLAAVVGFYLGMLFDWTGQIAVPILIHAGYNVFAFNMLARTFRSHRDRTDHSSSR